MAQADVASINLGGEINGRSSLSPILSSLPALPHSLPVALPQAQVFFLPLVSPFFLISTVWLEMSASSTLFVSQSLSLCSFCRVYFWFSLSVSPRQLSGLCLLFPLVPDFHHFDHFSVILGPPGPTAVPTGPAPLCF